MAGKKKPQREIKISPLGTAVYPHLNTPDDYEGKKTFHVDLKMPAERGQALVDEIDAQMEEIRKNPKVIAAIKARKAEQKANPKKNLGDIRENTPYYNVIDKETGEETGEVAFKFGTAAEGEYKDGPKKGQKWTRTLQLWDAKRKPLKKNVWGGSELKVAFSIGTYYINPTVGYGVKLYLESVQVIDLVTSGGGRSAEGYGFGEEEGYEASEDADETETSEETSTEETSSEGEDSGTQDDVDF